MKLEDIRLINELTQRRSDEISRVRHMIETIEDWADLKRIIVEITAVDNGSGASGISIEVPVTEDDVLSVDDFRNFYILVAFLTAKRIAAIESKLEKLGVDIVTLYSLPPELVPSEPTAATEADQYVAIVGDIQCGISRVYGPFGTFDEALEYLDGIGVYGAVDKIMPPKTTGSK